MCILYMIIVDSPLISIPPAATPAPGRSPSAPPSAGRRPPQRPSAAGAPRSTAPRRGVSGGAHRPRAEKSLGCVRKLGIQIG